MTEDDFIFVRDLLGAKVIAGEVLELGGGYGGDTCRDEVLLHGFNYRCTDMAVEPGARVDFIANFETGSGIETIAEAGPFDTVLVLNVLEHAFQPIAVLQNAARLLKPGGYLVTTTPCVWPIHNYPIDCQRLLPDWYRQFAAHSGMELPAEHFRYLPQGPVAAFRQPDGQDVLPQWDRMRGLYGLYSRAIHKLFQSSGQGVLFRPHILIGAAFRKPV